jgi:cyclopropane fatty-acyl-phospholipid synthase-like methyltransferase
MVYDPAYDNDQMKSRMFRAHVDWIVEDILAATPHHSEIHLLEVGCGQGALLRKLASTKRFASLTGFDPAWRGEDGGQYGGATMIKRLFEPAALARLPNPVHEVVTRHTIEHVHDPINFLRAIRSAIAMTSEARLFIETPDVEWIVKQFQPQDLFYEHCSIFSSSSLAYACEFAGFRVRSMKHVFGDQYLWAEAQPEENVRPSTPTCAFTKQAQEFESACRHYAEDWRSRIADLATSCDVWIWGASSKGVTFALLVDPDGTRLAGAIDINPDKIGWFMPATALSILGPEAVADGDAVIVMNSNYRHEIGALIESRGISVRLMVLDDAAD